jgi:hypothetical protein
MHEPVNDVHHPTSSRPSLETWLANCNRRPASWLAALAVLFAVQISPWWYPTPDTVLYLSVARSIATVHRVGALGNPQSGLPPGYPLLISPAFLFGDRPFLALSFIHWVMALVLMVGVHRWFNRHCPAAAVLLTVLVMVNVSVWIHYRRALSELAFMTVLVWTVHALNAIFGAQSTSGALRRGLLAGALLMLLSLIREVGLVCGAGFAVAALISVQRGTVRPRVAIATTLFVAIPAALAVVAFLLHDLNMKASSPVPIGTHVDGLMHPPATTSTDRLIEGVRLRVTDVGQLLVPGMFNAYGRQGNWLDLNMAVYAPLLVLVAVGWWKLVHGQPDVFALTLPFYLLAYIVWAFAGGSRYTLPMLPVLLASVWCVIEPLQRRRLTVLAVLLVGHLAVAIGYWIVKDIPRGRECNAQWRTVERLAAAIQGDRRGVLAADLPQCIGQMLAFTLDRPVQMTGTQGDDPHVRWIVMEDGEPAVRGFSVAMRVAPYELLVRDDNR